MCTSIYNTVNTQTGHERTGDHVLISIDVRDRRPIYEQIVEKYEMLIAGGVMAPGEQLPSVRQMASELSINPNTIQKAYAILEMKGFTYTVKGRGSFVSGDQAVAERKRGIWREKFISLVREGKELGMTDSAVLAAVREVYGGGGDD